ncbi:MAG: DUF1320 domain-containing protein [Oscillospiraceae bacterium]|nr:DUF1320 domain-containing protein [Oscillospiraceae bacterium]
MYCTEAEVLAMLKDDMIDAILGPEIIEDEEERRAKILPYCTAAIEDADAEIDGYLNKRYPVPLARTPQVVRKFSKDIAVYNLASRTGIDEDERENTIYIRYKNAISFLTLVAKGTVSIGVDEDGGGGSGSGAQDGFRLDSNDRIFSRDSMKGW